MSDAAAEANPDTAPGDNSDAHEGLGPGLRTYGAGLFLAALLTVVSFVVCRTTLVWMPSIPVALVVLAIAQMGVHIVFFLHVTTGPDHLNNILALAYGILIVFLIIVGSVWILGHLNANMPPMNGMSMP